MATPDDIPDSIFTWVFQADSGDSWGGWMVADSIRYAAGDVIATTHGRYTITAEEERGADLTGFGLEDGEVRVEWYRKAGGAFLATRAGAGVAVGLAGLGSEQDAAWTGSGWANFGRGGAEQVPLPAQVRFTWVFEAGSGDRLYGTLIGTALTYAPGDTLGTAYGTYRIIAKEDYTPSDPSSQEGVVTITRYSDARLGRDLALESAGSIAGTGGLGSETDRAWNGTAWVPVGAGGAMQADGQLFHAPQFLVASFAVNAGGWYSQDRYPRLVADLNGDGKLDIAGFGQYGVYASFQNAHGGFDDPVLVVQSFGVGAGGWTSQTTYPRYLADANGDGRMDIVGFGLPGVFASFQDADGHFGDPVLVVQSFGVAAGGWLSQDRHPRFVADMNGDGRADVVGFGDYGVYVSFQDSAGHFGDPLLVVQSFGVYAGGWLSQDRYPRLVADLNGDGRLDIAGFGDYGVYASFQKADGSFDDPLLVVQSFGVYAGGWTSQNANPRALADINGDGRVDVVGFGLVGLWAALQDEHGNFDEPRLVLNAFGPNVDGWVSQEMVPRMLADIDGDGAMDIIGFGLAGVYGATAVDII